MSTLTTRYERLDAIERRLAHTPAGCTTGELAAEFQVDADTIRRDLYELDARGTGLIHEGRRYILDHRKQLHSIKLNRDELMALYLAARLLSRHSDELNPHVASALEKLADAVGPRSPLIARHIAQAASAVRGKRTRPEYVAVLETLTQAWAEGRKVSLHYRSAKGDTTERIFAPYFIEPSLIGYTCYAIGRDELRGELRTLKIERILDARLTDERFEVPAAFDPQQLLRAAWGVIWPDEGEIEVALHFRADVVSRVKESVWHHSQRIEELADGSCVFTVRVGNTLELKPWIRQWGAAVTVLGPPALRVEIAGEVQELARAYAAD